MAVRFNVFTGNFDLTGSGGGGGASYIDGEVATYNDLPLDGTAALNTAWLVRSASGTWLIGRKPAGIYIRTATAGVSRDADYTYAGIFPDVFSDANFTLYDDGDATKTAQFQLSGITAGQNRTLTVPDASGTIATTADFAAPPAIGSTTPNSGAFATLTANNGTLTASAPVLDLSQTWNDSGTAFTAIKLDITNTASNLAGSKILDVSVGGTNNVLNIYRSTNSAFSAPMFEFGGTGVNSRMRVRTGGGVGVNFDGAVCVGGSLQFLAVSSTSASAGDVTFFREAADTLGMYRSTNPQTFNIYNTWTNTSNYERGFIRWSSNVLQIGTEAAGTGTLRGLNIGTATSSLLGFYGVTPVDQPATVTDPTGGGTQDAEARTAINDIIDRLQELGLIA